MISRDTERAEKHRLITGCKTSKRFKREINMVLEITRSYVVHLANHTVFQGKRAKFSDAIALKYDLPVDSLSNNRVVA